MSRGAFEKIMRGLKEAQAYESGERQGYKVTTLPTVGLNERPQEPGAPRLDSETWDSTEQSYVSR